MLCLVRYLFVISTGVIDCPGRFVPEMTYYVVRGTLNLTKPKLIFQTPVSALSSSWHQSSGYCLCGG